MVADDMHSVPRRLEGRASEQAEHVIRAYCARYRFIDNIAKGTIGKAGTKGSTIAFITVCPPEGTTLGELQDKAVRIVSKPYVERYFFVYEQRSTIGEDVRGVHLHILMHHENPHDSVRVMVKNMCGSWITDIKAKKPEWIKDKIAYMLGKKDTEAKRRMCERDTLWRGYEGMWSFYVRGDWNEFEGFGALRNDGNLLVRGATSEHDDVRISEWRDPNGSDAEPGDYEDGPYRD